MANGDHFGSSTGRGSGSNHSLLTTLIDPNSTSAWIRDVGAYHFPSSSSACASALLALLSPNIRASSLTRALRLA